LTVSSDKGRICATPFLWAGAGFVGVVPFPFAATLTVEIGTNA